MENSTITPLRMRPFPTQEHFKANKTSATFWNTFSLWKTPFSLSSYQCELIQAKKLPYRGKKVEATSLDLHDLIEKSEQISADFTISNAKEFSKELIDLVIDTVNKKYLEEKLLIIKNSSDSIAKYMKIGADWLVGIGNSVSQPMLDLFFENEHKQDVQDTLKRLLAMLKKDISAAQFKETLTKNLPKGTSSFHIDEVYQWIFHSDFSKPLKKEETIKTIFEKAILLLVEQKIDLLKDRLKEKLLDKLPDVLFQSLKENSQIIASPIIDRFLILLTNKASGENSFTQTFDKVFETVNDQAKRISEANQATSTFILEQKKLRKEAKRILSAAEEKEKKVPLTKDESDHKKRCEKYMSKLEENGGLEGLQRKHFLESFAKSGNLTLQGEKNPYRLMATQIVESILPSKKETQENDESPSIDGLEELFLQLNPPEEFKELFEETKEIISEILPEELITPLFDCSNSFKSLIKDASLYIGRNAIEWGVHEALDQVSSMISNPDRLNELMVNQILPHLEDAMISSFTKQILSVNRKKFLPLFTSWINSSDPSHPQKIQGKLYEWVAKECSQLEFKQEISHEKFNELIMPLLSDLYRCLNILKDNERSQTDEIKNHEVEAVLDQFFLDDEIQDEASVYSDLVLNFGFKLGEFGRGTQKLFNIKSIKNLIGHAILNGIKDLRSSPETLLDLAINGARDSLNQEEINRLISRNQSPEKLLEEKEQRVKDIDTLIAKINDESDDYTILIKEKVQLRKEILDVQVMINASHLEEASSSEVESNQNPLSKTKANLKDKLLMIAKIGHDIAFFHAGQASIFGKFVAKLILGANATHLHKVIQKLYNQFTSNEFMNRHLLTKVMSIFTNHLSKTANLENYHPVKVSSLLEPHHKLEFPKLAKIKNHHRIWKKIQRLIKFILKKLHIIKKHTINLNVRQIRMMDALENYSLSKIIQEGNEPRIEGIEDETTHSPEKPLLTSVDTPKVHDDSLLNMQRVIHNVVKITCDTFNNKIFSHCMKQGQEWYQLISENIKPAIDSLFTIADPVSKTLLKKIEEQNVDIPMDKAFFEVLKELKEQKEEDQELLFKNLEEKLQQVLKGKTSFTQKPQDYIDPVIKWLKNSKPSALIKEFPPQMKINENLINLASKEALKFLIENYVEKINSSLNKLMYEELPIIIPEMIETNLIHISQHLAEWFGDVMMNMEAQDYTSILDTIVQKANEQAKAFYEVELLKKENTLESLLEDPHHKAIWHPKLIQQKEEYFYQQIAHQLLKFMLPSKTITLNNEEIKVDGLTYLCKQFTLHEQLIQRLSQLKDFFKRILPADLFEKSDQFEKSILQVVEKFAIPHIKDFLTKHLAEIIKKATEKLTDHAFLNDFLANNLFPSIQELILQGLIVKMVIKNGELSQKFKLIIDTDLEDEHELFNLAEPLYKLIKQSQSDEGKNYGEFFWDIQQINLNDFQEKYLPGIIEDIQHSFTTQLMLESPSIYAYFKDWCNGESSEIEIYDHLFGLSGLNEENRNKFSQIITPFVHDISNMLISYKKTNKIEILSLDKAEKLIINYINPQDNDAPAYAEFISNVLKIGEFDSWTNYFFSWKSIRESIIGSNLVPALFKYRSSHRTLILSAMNALEKFLTQEKIEELLLAKSSEVEIRHDFNEELKMLSRKTYDFLMFNLTDVWGGQSYLQRRVGGHKAIKKMIKKFKAKFIEPQILLQNLIFNSLETALAPLVKTANKLSDIS